MNHAIEIENLNVSFAGRCILKDVKFEERIDMDILNDEPLLREAKTMGFSDKMIAHLINLKDNLRG